MIFSCKIMELSFVEICRVQQGGRPPGRDVRLLDIYNERPTRVSAKVSIPIREHPKVRNFFQNM